MFQTTLAVPPVAEHDRLLHVASAAAVLRTHEGAWTTGRWSFEAAGEPGGCTLEVPHRHLLATNPAAEEWDGPEGELRGMTEVRRVALVTTKGLRKRAALWLLRQQDADLDGPLPRLLGIRVVYALGDRYLCPVCEDWLPLTQGPDEHVRRIVG